jgi:CBS domain-containing protein
MSDLFWDNDHLLKVFSYLCFAAEVPEDEQLYQPDDGDLSKNIYGMDSEDVGDKSSGKRGESIGIEKDEVNNLNVNDPSKTSAPFPDQTVDDGAVEMKVDERTNENVVNHGDQDLKSDTVLPSPEQPVKITVDSTEKNESTDTYSTTDTKIESIKEPITANQLARRKSVGFEEKDKRKDSDEEWVDDADFDSIVKARMRAKTLAFMETIFGGSIPTLRAILGVNNMVCTRGSSSLREASTLMARMRKGIMVFDESGTKLQGIFTPKDLLNRVVAKEISPDDRQVSEFMTPNPECVSADMTLLDALREMHDHHFLHLPVKCTQTGLVLGVVDVMDIIGASAGDDLDGTAWRDFFRRAMESPGSSEDGGPSVAYLKPKEPIKVSDSLDILTVSKAMADARADAALLVNQTGGISGIITDNDVTRRVVSQFVKPTGTSVQSVMTKRPQCVSNSDAALDALDLMVEESFRHLPVLNEFDEIVGLMDIADCLHNAVSTLEKAMTDNRDPTSIANEFKSLPSPSRSTLTSLVVSDDGESFVRLSNISRRSSVASAFSTSSSDSHALSSSLIRLSESAANTVGTPVSLAEISGGAIIPTEDLLSAGTNAEGSSPEPNDDPENEGDGEDAPAPLVEVSNTVCKEGKAIKRASVVDIDMSDFDIPDLAW